MKICRLKMIKESLFGDENKEIEYFISEYHENETDLHVRYREENQGATTTIVANAEQIKIIRSGEVTSNIPLSLNERQTVVIDSPYGQMYMESKALVIVKKDNVIHVEYQLLQEQQVIGHYKITWQLLKEEIA